MGFEEELCDNSLHSLKPETQYWRYLGKTQDKGELGMDPALWELYPGGERGEHQHTKIHTSYMGWLSSPMDRSRLREVARGRDWPHRPWHGALPAAATVCGSKSRAHNGKPCPANIPNCPALASLVPAWPPAEICPSGNQGSEEDSALLDNNQQL